MYCYCVYVCVRVHTRHGIHVEVKERLCGGDSLLPPLQRFLGLNSGHPAGTASTLIL